MELKTPEEIMSVIDANRKALLDSILNVIAEKISTEFTGSDFSFSAPYSQKEFASVWYRLCEALTKKNWNIHLGKSFSDQISGSYTEVTILPIEQKKSGLTGSALVEAYYSK